MLKHCFSVALNYWRLSATYVVLKEHLHFDFKPSEFPWWLKSIFKDIRRIEGDGVMDERFFITLPKGFVCDLASIPKYLQWMFKPDGPWAKAAAIHDFLYNLSPPSNVFTEHYNAMEPKYAFMEAKLAHRSCCDALFYMAMRKSGVNAAVALSFYLAVRACGSSSFRTGKSIKVGDLLTQQNTYTYGYAQSPKPYPIFTSSPFHYEMSNRLPRDFTLLSIPNLPTPLIVK